MSERETADRNYALGYYMKEHKCFPEGANFKECMDFYFQVLNKVHPHWLFNGLWFIVLFNGSEL